MHCDVIITQSAEQFQTSQHMQEDQGMVTNQKHCQQQAKWMQHLALTARVLFSPKGSGSCTVMSLMYL